MGEKRTDEDGEPGKTSVTARREEGREGEKKKGTWLRDEERDRWIKERDG